MSPTELKASTKTYALRIIKLTRAIKLIAIVNEANDLTAMMAASRKTASGKQLFNRQPAIGNRQ